MLRHWQDKIQALQENPNFKSFVGGGAITEDVIKSQTQVVLPEIEAISKAFSVAVPSVGDLSLPAASEALNLLAEVWTLYATTASTFFLRSIGECRAQLVGEDADAVLLGEGAWLTFAGCSAEFVKAMGALMIFKICDDAKGVGFHEASKTCSALRVHLDFAACLGLV